MLQMANVIVAAIVLRGFLGTLVIAVDDAFVILGHHGVGPEVAGHGLGDILLNGSLLGAGQDIGTQNKKWPKQNSIMHKNPRLAAT